MTTTVLVVDDEPQIRRTLALNLAARGYGVRTAADGTSALDELSAQLPDIVLLDLGLPDLDGLDVLRAVRAVSALPVLVLSARVDSSDKVSALDLGADDYVTKPFDMQELLARLRALTRRAGGDLPQTVAFGGVVVNLSAKLVHRDGAPVHLTPTEWQLLEVLLRNPGRLIGSRQLLVRLRGAPDHTDASYLRIYISQLRRKLEADPGRPQHLLTEPGMGYRFVP